MNRPRRPSPKKPVFRIKPALGKFHVSVRPPGHQYFRPTGKAFFSKSDAEKWIATQLESSPS